MNWMSLCRKKVVSRFVLVLTVVTGVIIFSVPSYGTVGDVWNIGLQFSTANNPNGVWTYLAYPSLVTMIAGTPHGGTGWINPAATYQSIQQNGTVGGYIYPATEVGGHAHSCFRWTSPVEGRVQVSGHLFMLDTFDIDPTRVHWFILYRNGIELSRGSVKLNPDQTAIVGRSGMVTLAEGNGGSEVLICDVVIGDTIDMAIYNIGGPGHWYGASLEIEQLPYWPTWPVCGDSAHPYPLGDINKDCIVDLSDFAELAANWLLDINP